MYRVSNRSCSPFQPDQLQVQELNKISLSSSVNSTTLPETVGQEQVSNFIKACSYVAAAAPRSSKDTVWLIQVLKTNLASCEVTIFKIKN